MNRNALMIPPAPLRRTAGRFATLLALACAVPAAWADSREMPASAMLPAY